MLWQVAWTCFPRHNWPTETSTSLSYFHIYTNLIRYIYIHFFISFLHTLQLYFFTLYLYSSTSYFTCKNNLDDIIFCGKLDIDIKHLIFIWRYCKTNKMSLNFRYIEVIIVGLTTLLFDQVTLKPLTWPVCL